MAAILQNDFWLGAKRSSIFLTSLKVHQNIRDKLNKYQETTSKKAVAWPHCRQKKRSFWLEAIGLESQETGAPIHYEKMFMDDPHDLLKEHQKKSED